jgi:hypothetical protein
MMRISARTTSGGLRWRFCPDCGEMHDRDEWPGNHRRPGEALAAPQIVGDTMDALQSQASGKMYDSKSELRKEYKALGMQEVGNDSGRLKPKAKDKPDRKKIHDAVHKAKARFDRGERSCDAMKFK